MGLLSVLGNLAGSFLGGPTGGSIGGAIGGAIEGRDATSNAREAAIEAANMQNAANLNLSRENREWQEQMRASAYQTTVKDLQAAGLNPMLAYSNGATQTPGAPSSANMVSHLDKAPQMAAQIMQAENLQADTSLKQSQVDVNSAQAENLRAQTVQTGANTENIRAMLPNIQAELTRIVMNKDLMYQQGLTETTRRQLMEAQTEVERINKHLRGQQISESEALTELRKVQEKLAKLEIAGAQNISDFESRVGEMGPTTRAIHNIVKIIRGR